VFVCLAHGHNAFLTAALFGGGLLMLERRPFVAGLLLGCLAYKPQFAAILPLALAAGGYWRTILGRGSPSWRFAWRRWGSSAPKSGRRSSTRLG
jgi:hypothetical protein